MSEYIGIGVYKAPVYICEIHGEVTMGHVTFQFPTETNTESRVYCYRCIEELLRKHIKPVKKKEDL
jgi:hypothetical protein